MNPQANQSSSSHRPGFKDWNPGFVSTLIGCLLGGFVGGAIVHRLHPMFARPDLPEISLGASAELVQEHRDAEYEHRSFNYAAELAIIGAALGLAFGAAVGHPKRVLSLLVGGVVGAAMGSAGGYLGGRVVADAIFQNRQQTLQASMGLQAIVWGAIFAGIVWSVAALHVGPIRALKYGLFGLITGGAVAVTQFVVSSIVFPTSNPLFLIPEQSSERLYWLIAFPIVSGLVLALCLRPRRSGSNATQSAASVA